MPARTRAVAAAIIVAAISSAQAQAQQRPQQQSQQSSQAWEWCRNQGGNFSPDLRISGCTSVIQSGRENQRSLASAFNSRGNAYWAKREYDRAIADYDQAIRLNPSDPVFFSNRGGVLAAKGEFDRAIIEYDQAIRINPNVARIYNDRGNAYRNKGLFDRAIADYEQAIKLDPNFAPALTNRGHAFHAKKDFDRAIADYDRALRLNPKDANAASSRGYASYAKKDYERAIADFDLAIRLDPNHASAFNGRGNAHLARREHDRAVADYSQAIKINPAHAVAFNGRGNAFSAKGQHDRALADYDQAIRLNPNAFSYTGRCLSRAVIGQLQQALADCNEALRLQPNDPRPLGTRGFAYFKLGQYDNAIADFDAALRLDPTRAPSLYGRGLAKLRKGDAAGGNADMNAAKAIKSDVAEQFARYGEEPMVSIPVVTSSIGPATPELPKAATKTEFRKRVALVIGNSKYVLAPPLRNPGNDAADVSVALRGLGFEVVEGIDVTRRGFDDVVREFGRKLDGADLALFFYAGHGLQVNGRNYLVPVDAKLERPGDLALDAVDISVVLAQMEAEKRVNLVLLDACRDNPFARSLARAMGARSGSVGVGLAMIQSAIGTMIAFATQPDNVALDGEGRNSPFTSAVLKHIGTRGTDIATVMRRVRADVIAATREKQVPWDHSSLVGDVILAQ